jgi:hypothetical protein
VSEQVWHDKDGNGDSRQIAEKLLVRLKTNKKIFFSEKLKFTRKLSDVVQSQIC